MLIADTRWQVYENYVSNAIFPLNANSDVFLVLDVLDDLRHAGYAAALRVLRPVDWIRSSKDQHGKWVDCYRLMTKHENRSGIAYDYVIKSRPDVLILRRFPPVELFPTNAVWARPRLEVDPDHGQSLVTGSLDDYYSWKAPSNLSRRAPTIDILLIFPRHLASTIMKGVTRLRTYGWAKVSDSVRRAERVRWCGEDGASNVLECDLTTVARRSNISVVWRPFDFRLVRPVSFKGCRPTHKRFDITFKSPLKLFSSVCL